MAAIVSDVRDAVRLHLRRPRFALVAVAMLAMAIGAAVAVFSLVRTVILRDLPFAEPDRLVWMYNARTERDRAPLSIPDLEDYRREARTLEALAPFTNWTANLTGNGDAERLEGVRVAGNFFDLLAGRPALGRTLGPGDETADARVLAASIGSRRVNARLLELAGEIAMALTALGTYALAAFAAGLRRRELAIRSVLGASQRSLVQLMFRRELPPLVGGLVAGLAVALAVSRALGGLLFATSPWNPAVYAAVAGTILFVTAAAVWLPARRAAVVNPAALLRT